MNLKPINWSPNFAYATGLFVADGHLSIDGRHLDFTSKDKDQVQNFKKAIGLKNRISKKSRGGEDIKKYYYIGFGYKKLYQFFQKIGVPQQKSNNIGKLDIPNKYFPDFVRGLLDGDGSIHIYQHPETKNKQLKLRFFSGSRKFLFWLQSSLHHKLKIRGQINRVVGAWLLVYSKRESLKLIKYIYYSKKNICLKRKSIKAFKYYNTYRNFDHLRWQNRFTVLNH